MNSSIRTLIAFAVIATAGYLGWRHFSSNESPVAESKVSVQANKNTTNTIPPSEGLPVQAVLKINPRLSAPAASGASAAIAKPVAASPLIAAYISGKDWPGLYAQVANRDDAEGVAIRLKLMRSCAKKTDEEPGKKPALSRDEKRANFIATIPANAPEREARIGAYDEVNQEKCGALSGLTTTTADIDALEARALELKDPAAVIESLDCALAKSRAESPDKRQANTMSPEQFTQLTDVLASKDPYAARAAVGLLTNTLRNGKIVWRDTGEALSQSALFDLSSVLPCELGSNCEQNLLHACAFENKCATRTYADYLAFYRLSPHGAQELEHYRQRFMQMINTKDFSALKFELGEQDVSRNVTGSSYHSCGSKR